MNVNIERLGWVLIHSIWQFGLIALVAAIGVRFMNRRTAASRYIFLVAAMAVAIAAPIATWIIQPVNSSAENAPRVELLRQIHADDLAPVDIPILGTLPPAREVSLAPVNDVPLENGVAEIALTKLASVTSTAPQSSIPSRSLSERLAFLLRPWFGIIVATWGLGVLLCSTRPLFGWRTLYRLKRVGISPVTDEIRASLGRVSAQLGMRWTVEILLSSLAHVPVVVGYFKPVILLPVSFAMNVPPAQLEAILAHELAHVRRHDFIVNLVQTLMETLFFYHPAIWWMSHQIRIEREHCCDDLVIRILQNRVEYGRALVAVEQLRGGTSVLALGVADGSLLARVRRIVGMGSDRTEFRSNWPVVLVGITILGFVLNLTVLSSPPTEPETPTADEAAEIENRDGVTRPRAYVANFADGLSIELVGMTKNTRPASNGWRPDGRPLEEEEVWPSTILLHDKNITAAYLENEPHPDPDDDAIDFLFRFRGLKSLPSVTYQLPALGGSYHRHPLSDPYLIRACARLRGSQPNTKWNPPDGVVRVGLTDQPWGQWIQISPEGEVVNPLNEGDLYRKEYDQIRIKGVVQNDRAPDKRVLLLTQPKDYSTHYDFQIRGIDPDGKEQWVLQWQHQDVPGTDEQEERWGVSNQEKKPVARYEFRLRPYQHWVTFENVSLAAGQHTEVISKSESNPMERPGEQIPRIMRAESEKKVVWISVSADIPLKPKMSFSVCEARTAANQPAVIKGTIEITRIVGEDHTSQLAEARILEEQPETPLAKGDEVILWKPVEPGKSVDALGPIRALLKLKRKEFLLGESIGVTYEMTNMTSNPAEYGKGAFFSNLRYNDGFRISAVKVDADGRPGNRDGIPVKSWPKPDNDGGKRGGFSLAAGEKYSTNLFVTRHLRFQDEGIYRLKIENVDRLDPSIVYSVAETQITLRMPTPDQARGIFLKMKKANRQAYDDNAMNFLLDAADFQSMLQPAYLPILKEYALMGDIDALESLGRMEGVAANEILVEAMTGALDRDDWRTARACFQQLKPNLPFPNWYVEPLIQSDAANRDRVARNWRTEFNPTLTRLARRLSAEVQNQVQERDSKEPDADANDPEFLKVFRNGLFPLEHPQSLLIDIDFIYRCLGQPDDFGDCLTAYMYSIQLTKSLPLETNQYFRPRGSASGFGHTILEMMKRGAKPPTNPAHPGEAAAFAYAVFSKPDFRPVGWQAELIKCLKGDLPYLAELILTSLPTPVPNEILEYLPESLGSDYVDLQIAACHVARKNPCEAYRAPLQKILDHARDKYLRKYAVDAARANGLVAKYDVNAPFVDQAEEQTISNPQTARKDAAYVLPDHLNVMAVEFDRDQSHLVTVSTESDVRIRKWDTAQQKLASEIKLETDKHGNRFLQSHLTLADGCRRVIATIDGKVGIWDATTGKVVRMLDLPGHMSFETPRALSSTPASDRIACGTSSPVGGIHSGDVNAVVWDVATGQVLQTVRHIGAIQIQSIALSPDGKWLATGGQQAGTCIWDVATGKMRLALSNNNPGRRHPDEAVSAMGANQVLCLKFSPNGNFLAISDMLGVKLVDVQSGELQHQFESPYRFGRSGLVFSHDGQLLARTATDKMVPIWSTRTGKLVASLSTESNGGAFSSDGKWFAVGLSDVTNAVAVWHFEEGIAANLKSDQFANVNEPSPMNGFRATAKPEQPDLMVGEPGWVFFDVHNDTNVDKRAIVGGDDRNGLGRPDSFKIVVTDDQEKPVTQPSILLDMGGISYPVEIPAKKSTRFKLFIPHWAVISRPGKYRMTIQRELDIVPSESDGGQNAFELKPEKIPVAAETILTIVPADEARFGEMIKTYGPKLLSQNSDDAELANKMLEAIRVPVNWLRPAQTVEATNSLGVDERAMVFYLKLLDQRNGRRKQTALRFLGRCRSEIALNTMIAALNISDSEIDDVNPAEIRQVAVHSLATFAEGNLSNQRATKEVLSLANHVDVNIRRAVLYFAARVNSEAARAVVELLTRDSDKAVADDARQIQKAAGEAKAKDDTKTSDSENPAILRQPSVKGRVTIEGTLPEVPPLKMKLGLILSIHRNPEEVKENERRTREAVVTELPDDSLVISKDGGVANVAIYLKKAPIDWKRTDSPTHPIEIRSSENRFQPRMSLIRVGQPLRLTSRREDAENFACQPVRSSPFSVVVPPGEFKDIPAAFTESERLPTRVTSVLHIWQTAWLLGLDHPFATMSDSDGRIEIHDLPPGEHHFVVWHERRGYLHRDLIVRKEAGKITQVDLKFKAEQFQPVTAPRS